MLRLPVRFAAVILAFAPVFVQQRTWRHAQLLLLGAVLAPGQRTVTNILRIIGLRRERHFVNFHRVLNRAVWSSLRQDQRVVLAQPDAAGAHSLGAAGWGLPFLTVLAPSERFSQSHDRRHKTLTDWTRQVALQARRWLPQRTVILVGDSSFAVLDLLAALTRQGLIGITRLRLDAALYEPAAPREAGTKGRPRKKGVRLPTLAQRLADPNTDWRSIIVSGWYGNTERRLEICSDCAVWYHAGLPVLPIRWVLLRDPAGDFEPQALLCTDPERDPRDIIGWFVRRWSLEVTFRETRDHLGVETQRQWFDQAIARTTPCLLGLFSIVTLLATRLRKRTRLAVSAATWYRKQHPTFADTLAAVRREIWVAQGFSMSRCRVDSQKLSKALCDGMTYALCNAA